MDSDLSSEFRDTFEFQSQKFFETSKRESKLCDRYGFWISKAIIKFYVAMCEANLYQEISFRLLTSKETRRKLLDKNHFKARWWNLIHRVSIIYLITKQLVALLFQYAYDVQKLEHNRRVNEFERKQQSETAVTNNVATAASQSQHERSVEISLSESSIRQYEAALKLLGAPFIKLSFAVECMVVFIVWNVITLYAVTMLYYKFIGPINLSLFRMLDDEDREQRNISKLIIEELNKVLLSSRCYLAKTEDISTSFQCSDCNTQSQFSIRLSNTGELVTEKVDATSSLSIWEPTRSEIFDEYNLIVKLVKRLALSGSLQPANRMPNWLVLISWLYVSLYITFVVSGLTAIFMMISPYGVRRFLTLGPEYSVETGLMDCVSLVELDLIAFLTTIVAAFGIALLICVFVDQSYLVYKLSKLIDGCISENSEIFPVLFARKNSKFYQRWQQSKRRQIGRIEKSVKLDEAIEIINGEEQFAASVERMNGNLIGVLLHYRIFVRQFQPLRHLFSYVAVLMTSFYILYPIFALAHVPYVSRSNCILLVVAFWSFVLWYDCAATPICLYHAQIQHLYSHLFRLMAHVDAMQSMSPEEFPVYKPQIVALFRREIEDPVLAERKVSITLLGGPLSYKYLLRMHLTTLILSMYAISNNENGTHRSAGASAGPSIFGLFI